MRQTQAGLDRATDQAMDVARDVIDRRINALGTLEPTIIRQGSNRILVQVPGLQDPEALKSLIGRTARLEFKLVDLNVTPEQIAVRPGADRQPDPALCGRRAGRAHRRPAPRDHHRRHDRRRHAGNSTRPTAGRTSIIRFDSNGSHRFARVTQENVDKPFAIILDNVVISAPQHPRADPRRHRLDHAAASPSKAPTSSPSRCARAGCRSSCTSSRSAPSAPISAPIRSASGVIASIVATFAVIVFMLITYGRFGVYTTIALILNGLMIIGIMALFNATLTLPGIAGFVLTIGAAVDANVLINERIREEQTTRPAAARRARERL